MNAVEATLDKDGRITFAEAVRVTKPCRVMVTFLSPIRPAIGRRTRKSGQNGKISFGGWEGKISVPDNFNEPLADFGEYMP